MRLPFGESPCQTIRGVVLVGDRAGQFHPLLAAAEVEGGHDDSPVGRCIGARGIAVVVQRMQQALVAEGYVTTRVLAGPQDLSDGLLQITLVPGVIHALRPAADASPRLAMANAIPARPGDLLQLRDIEQGLENFQRVPTAAATLEIEPASHGGPGESDLVVHYQQAFPLRLNLSVDDGGTRATGREQATATLSYDHWWTLNDLFYLSLGHSLGRTDARGTRASTVHYSVPWGYWLIGATASHNRYFQSVAGASQTYLYSGTSDTAELRASRVVWRDASRKTTLGLRTFRRSGASFIDDTEIEVQHRVTAGWEASLAQHQYVGNAVLDASLAYRRGTGAFGAQPAPEQAFGEGTSRLKIVTADVALVQPFAWAGQRFRYSAAWRAQWNQTPLTPQDRFAIGGRYSVRGFDGENTLLAERGWFWRNDLGWAAGAGQEVYLGLDTGRVGGPSAAFLAGNALVGGAFGLRGSWKALSYDVFVGRPLKKPEGLRTAGVTAGINVSVGF